jgi:hypothetical protein
MKLTGGEGGAHEGSEPSARVVIRRRPQLISVLGDAPHGRRTALTARRAPLVVALSLLASTLAADAPLPPQQELRGIKVVYLDVRVYNSDPSRPELVPQPEVEGILTDQVRRALSGAKIRVAEQPRFDTPQLRVWVDLVRTGKAPGFVAVGTRIEYTDGVRLRRAPRVGATHQATLWSAHETDLVVDSGVTEALEARVTKGVEEFLSAVRYAEDPKAFWSKQ